MKARELLTGVIVLSFGWTSANLGVVVESSSWGYAIVYGLMAAAMGTLVILQVDIAYWRGRDDAVDEEEILWRAVAKEQEDLLKLAKKNPELLELYKPVNHEE